MSLRYARLFDPTVRASNDRALSLAKQRLGQALPPPTPAPRSRSPTASGAGCRCSSPGWPAATACLRTAVQDVCPYTNIGEHSPTSAPSPRYCTSWPPSAPTPWPPTSRRAARSTTPPGTDRWLIERLDALIGRTQVS